MKTSRFFPPNSIYEFWKNYNPPIDNGEDVKVYYFKRNFEQNILIPHLIYLVLFGPLLEEYLFRFFIYDNLLKSYFKLDHSIAILLSSLVFSFAHIQNHIDTVESCLETGELCTSDKISLLTNQLIMTFFLGISLCLIYDKFHLPGSILLHILFNARGEFKIFL